MADKHIRLNSRLNAVAAFWEPHSPGEVMTGNLTVNEDGIHFVTSPKYATGSEVGPPNFNVVDFSSIPKTAILHGFFAEGDCTLLHLMIVDYPGLTSYMEDPKSILSTDYRAAVLISGMHTGGYEEKWIDSARYIFSSLAEWLIMPLKEEWGEKCITINVPAEEIDVLDVCVVSSRSRIEIKARHELTTGQESRSRLTRPVAIIEVTSSQPDSLSWFAEAGNRLENLFSLLTGTSLGMETMFIYREKQSGTVIRKHHEYISPYEFFDSIKCTHSQLALAIATWMSESEGFREIENLLLGVLRKGKLFVETEFLSLAQALEGFHRATGEEIKLPKAEFRVLRKSIADFLVDQQIDEETQKRVNSAVSFANQTSFRSRLMELCERMSEDTLTKMKISPVQFVAEVVQMRNSFTHAGASDDKDEGPILGGELFLLSRKMRALLRGVFLLHLGFPESQVAELIIREATKWKV